MRNLIPRSEADAFRLLVIVIAAAAAVIAAALAIDPLAGAIVLGVELVAGVWVLAAARAG
ncbi:MAG: hypothetical protein ACR2G3_07065 [Solirubrobacterales bacterium]